VTRVIRTAAAGQSTWTREELRRVAGALATPRLSADNKVPLTMRETEVLEQITHGSTNKEIARALNIGLETVKDHVHELFHPYWHNRRLVKGRFGWLPRARWFV
jgi:DNA-binding NarL/FixJ family response regulator